MDVVDNNVFPCIWLLETIFRFYMDVMGNNNFLDVFHVFGCWKQYLDFTWMLWVIVTSLMLSMYLVVGNNI